MATPCSSPPWPTRRRRQLCRAVLDIATTADLDFFRTESDLFLSAQIGGPISSLDWTLGMEDMMVWCLTDTDAMAVYAGK